MTTAAGDFVSKIPVTQSSQATCEQAAASLPTELEGTTTQLKGICVTREHWTGERYMPNVPLHR